MVSFPLPCYSWVFGWPGTAKHLKGLSHSTPDISPDGLRLTDCLSFHQKSAEDPLIPRVPGGTMSESTLIPSNPGLSFGGVAMVLSDRRTKKSQMQMAWAGDWKDISSESSVLLYYYSHTHSPKYTDTPKLCVKLHSACILRHRTLLWAGAIWCHTMRTGSKS